MAARFPIRDVKQLEHFVLHLTHQIQESLQLISGYWEIYAQGKKEKDLSVISQEITNLNKLIPELTDFYQYRSGKYTLILLDLQTLLHKVCVDQGIKHSKHVIDFHSSVRGTALVAIDVFGFETLIDRLFSEMLSHSSSTFYVSLDLSPVNQEVDIAVEFKTTDLDIDKIRASLDTGYLASFIEVFVKVHQATYDYDIKSDRVSFNFQLPLSPLTPNNR